MNQAHGATSLDTLQSPFDPMHNDGNWRDGFSLFVSQIFEKRNFYVSTNTPKVREGGVPKIVWKYKKWSSFLKY